MKIIAIMLAIITALLQYRLWVGDGSLAEVMDLRRRIQAQTKENQMLTERNQLLTVETLDLRDGLDAVEARARRELGMIRKGEVFYMVVEE